MALSKSTRLLIKKTTEAIRAYSRLKKSKIARRQQKRSETRLRHAAELDAAESTLKSVLAGFFSKQVESAISLFEKSQPFDPREWDGELIAQCLPAMAKTMGDSMISELESYGINAQKLKSISLDLWKKVSSCGAGSPGDPGFAVNNTCQSGDKGSSSESNFLDPSEFPLAGSGHLPLNATGSLNDYIRPENHTMLRKFGAGKGVISRELRSEMRKIAVSDRFRLKKDEEFVFGLRLNEYLENQIKDGNLFFSGSRSMAFADEIDRAKSYGELTVRVKAPKGSRVFTLSVLDKEEASILPGSSMKITKQSNVEGNRVLEVELIDDGTSKTLKMLDFFDEQESKKSVSFLTKASTASEWLEQAGESLVEGGLLNSLTGEVDFGFMAEYPEWMRQAIRENLEETFSQDYWKAINDTTSEDITSILQKGAQDGWSVQRIAKEMSTKFVEDGRYPMNRGRLVARTELGHALNGARSMAMDALIEEVGSDLPMRKQWLSVLGTTTRDSHAHLDGVPADKEGRWSLAGVKCRWPGDVVLPAKERCNCQCSIIMAFGMDDDSASELISDYSERVAKKKSVNRDLVQKRIEGGWAVKRGTGCGAGSPGAPGFAQQNTCNRHSGPGSGGGGGSVSQKKQPLVAAEDYSNSKVTNHQWDLIVKGGALEKLGISSDPSVGVPQILSLTGLPGGPGMSFEISSVLNGIVVRGRGGEVGSCARTLRFSSKMGPYIENDRLFLKKTGSGLGLEILARQVQAASDFGFSHLFTDAAGGPGEEMNGYYAWPRLGYDSDLLPKFAGETLKEKHAFFQKNFPAASRVSDLMKTPEGRKAWKSHGYSLLMKFDLKQDSVSRKVFDQYVEAKFGSASGSKSYEDSPEDEGGESGAASGVDRERRRDFRRDLGQGVVVERDMEKTQLIKTIETLEAAVNLIEKASACGAGAPGKPGFAPGNTCQGGGEGSAGQGGASSGPAPEKKKFNPASYVPPVVDSDGIPLPGSVGSLVDVDTSSMKGGTTIEKLTLARMAAIEKNVLNGSFDAAFKMFVPPLTKAKEKGYSLIADGAYYVNAHKIMQEFQKKLKELHESGYFNPSAAGKWKQVGPQLGTEKGGTYELNGQKYYVKIPDDPNRAKKEVLATELYALATGSVAKAQLIEIEGKPAYATPFLDLGKANWDDPLVRQKAQKDYAIHAWLNNRDAVGAGSENPMDNIKVQKDGSLILVDAGGSFDQKGMGGSSKKKPFDDEASEWFSLKDPTKNPTTAKVFGSMTIAQDIESGSRLGFDRFSDEAIRKLCKERGFPEIGEKLIKRRAAILKNVDQLKKITADAAKSDQPKKDESLSKSLLENATLPPAPIIPPSWQGTLGKKISTIVEAAESVKNGGSVSDAVAKIEAVKAGEKSKEPQYIKFNEWKASTLAVLKNSKNIESSPAVSQESTKPKVPVNLKISTPDPEFYSVNKAMVAENKAIIDAIKTHAQAGDLGTLLQCGLDGEIEIMTGTGLGFEKVEIKSPKVKQYLDSVMKEVEAHLKGPPKAKSGTLSSIAKKVLQPSGSEPTLSSTEGSKKFGYWDVLGSTSPQNFQIPGKSLTPTEKTHLWKKGEKVYDFLGQKQQSSLKYYTGGGYTEMNESLRDEKPTEKAKTAAKALMENAHEVPIGAVLTRKHGNASSVDYSKLKPGTVVSDKAILSTSASGKWNGSVKWEMTAGPGVRGLGAKKFSIFSSEDEVMLPPNQRMLVTSVEKEGKSGWKIKAVILPTIETQCCDHLN